MKLNCVELKAKDYVNIIPLGDIHFGAKECDIDKLEEWIDWIKHDKNTSVMLMGDLINCGTKVSIGAGTFDDDYNPEEQYYKMIEYLKPIRKKIIGAHLGNHEERIRMETSFDITKLMCKDLDVPYLGYSALSKIRVNDLNYIVCSTHGSTGSGTIMGKLNGCRKMMDIADADLYLYGHTHGLAHDVQSYRRVDLKNKMIVEDKKHFVLTGNFIDWDGSYGEKKNYPLLKKGCPRVRLYAKEKDIHVSL